MTLYDDREQSDYDGSPVEVYEFIGTHQTYRYTSSKYPITVLGEVYEPIPISRGNIMFATSEDDGDPLEIEIPSTSQLARDYAFQIAPPVLELNVYRVHESLDGTPGNSDARMLWSSRRVSFKLPTSEREECIVTSASMFSSAMSTNVPDVFYQGPCNNVFMDPDTCRVPRAPNTLNATAVTVANNMVTLDSVGAWPNQSFRGGSITNLDTGESRMIVSQIGTLLKVNYPFASLSDGTPVVIVRGCDHDYNGDCKNKYNNRERYTGFKYIPDTNIFEKGLD